MKPFVTPDSGQRTADTLKFTNHHLPITKSLHFKPSILVFFVASPQKRLYARPKTFRGGVERIPVDTRKLRPVLHGSAELPPKKNFQQTLPNVRRTSARIRADSAANWRSCSLEKCPPEKISKKYCRPECTSSSVLGGKRSQLCLCCRPTHSPSGSPIRTTSSIRCGAGTVGY